MKDPKLDGAVAGAESSPKEKKQEDIISADLQNVSGLPNSALYRFFESLIESVRSGEFDDQIEEYMQVKKVARKCFSDRKFRDKFWKYEEGSGYISMQIPLETPNGVTVNILPGKPNEGGFLFWKYKKMSVNCEIVVENKKTYIGVEFQFKKKALRTTSGFVQLKDLAVEIVNRMVLLEKKQERDGAKEMNDKLVEFSNGLEE